MKTLKIINKKKFTLSCIFFTLILVFAIVGNEGSRFKESIPTNSMVLNIDKLGSINLNEDNSFKTYVINCKRDMKDVKWQESKEFYKITLGKNDVENLNINALTTGKSKEIYYEKKDGNNILYIKKNFEKGNSLNVDRLNSKRIIVLIHKSSKVYKYKIVVDPGHGGEDKGTNYGKLYEKDITLKIAKYIEEYLNGKDCQVIMTRDSDKFIYLNSIAQLNNDANPDMFISIHVDSNKVETCKGVSTYYYYNTLGYQKDERMKLAKTIEEQMIKDDNWNYMGIKQDHLLVLSKSTAVSTLIECGFISNSQDRARFRDEDVLKRLSRNISEGILEYLNAEKSNKIK